MTRKLPNLAFFGFVLLVASGLAAQTFEINPQPNPPSQSSSGKKSSSKKSPSSTSQTASPEAPSGGIGWGSGIEVAREARAAQQALNKGDYATAVASAQRAAKSAPGDTNLWFLLGYSARLAGKYQISVDAYQRGLQNQPSSIQGLSGLAQTYARMGQASKAQEILKQVLAANPKSVTDLLLAGELALSQDPNTAVGLLKRGEAIEPSSRAELLIARAYQRLNQPDQMKAYLDRAQSRDPNDPNVLRAVAAFYRDAKQYDLAIATLKKAGKAASALPELAYTYQLAGKKKEAADTYTEAASRTTGDPGLQLSAAQALVNVHDFARANKFLQRAESLDADSYRLHAIRGQIASSENRAEHAIREYQFAVSHLPPEGVPEGPLYPVQLHLSLYELFTQTTQPQLAETELAAAKSGLSQITGLDEANQPEFLRLRSLVEADYRDYASAEKDIKQAQSLDPNNVNITLNYANLLQKMDRKQESYQLYQKALTIDPANQAGLTGIGYLARDLGDPRAAEKYFTKLASLYPDDYVPYLALGDLYTADKDYPKAQANYERAHKIAPTNPLVVSGGINSALESHQMAIAKNWVDRAVASSVLSQSPQVMREHERYLTLNGKYAESAELGYKVLEKLPRDPEAPVYLAYDLLFLNKYEEAYAIAVKYQPILPKDKDLRLIAGYVHAHYSQLNEAVADFTKAIELAPNVPTSYVNRGFVLNDLKEATRASQDFETALKLRPDYGEAHLGLAYANLRLRRSKPALKEANIAAKLLGESNATHLARAEAYRQQVQLTKAEAEYRAALKIQPNNVQTRISLADVLFRQRRFDESIQTLKNAVGVSPQDDATVYAQMARAYAELHDRDNTLKAVTAAEQKAPHDSKVLLATGEALLTLGDRQAAMEHYSRALTSPDADRVETRLALARFFAHEGRAADAEQQISLGFAEARVGEANPVTADNILQAAYVLMEVKDFDLAKKYFERAQTAGADPEAVNVGLANAYLALGETQSAHDLLASLGTSNDTSEDYQYLIAMANVYQQQRDTVQALTYYARANRLVTGNDYAARTELDLAGAEGRQINDTLSVTTDASFSPIFEDINIYTLDAKLRGLSETSTVLPPPRTSFESLADARYRVHLNGFPVISGLVEERNARGTVLIPSEFIVQNRNTYDTIFNGAINPVLKFGNNRLAFTPGLQFTVRRDTSDPHDLNQNLFRQYLYIYSSPFFNWLSFTATGIREAGPFTEQNLHSRDLIGKLDFVVGRPWGKTSLITGYEVRDLLFRPLIREYFSTSTYVGVQRKFGEHIKASVFGEYLRSWRVQDQQFAIAQAIRPAFNLEVKPNMRWTISATGVWSRGEGYHAYDNITNSFLVSYVRSVERPLSDGVPVTYPLRFSLGLEQQTFYNFVGQTQTQVRPVIRFTLF
ncbi:MAG TPA: tetratricopeptide repeat protein [Terriglobales bacterium]|nr:tetratricopeptide repeat protein [Terriglobales bacterium]